MLRQWSFLKVALLSVGWVAACVAAAVAWVLVPAWLASTRGAGSGGIGAVSVGLNVFMLAIPILPPVLLFVAWLTVKLRLKQTSRT